MEIQPPDIPKVSKIELAKVLKSIKDLGLTTEEYQNIKSSLVPSGSEAAVEEAVKGLSEEDEFALMCRLMGTATHLVPLEQRPLVPGDYIPPDFLAKFQPGCSIQGYGREDSTGFKCFIEVKSTEKDEFIIGGSLLSRRRKFADEFGMPLLLAVRFLRFSESALWVIVEDSDRQLTSLKIKMGDLIRGVRHIIWDEYFLLLRPRVYFIAVFDSKDKGVGVIHSRLGIQKEFHIIVDDQTISLFDKEAGLYSMFFESFNLEESKIECNGSIGYQYLVPKIQMCSIADIIFRLNRLVCDEKGQVIYDASKIIARSDIDSDFPLFDRNLVVRVAQPLIDSDLLLMIGVGEQGMHLQKWRQYGGRR